MKKILIIVGILLVIIGSSISIISLANNNWDFSNLFTKVNYNTSTYNFEEEINGIVIESNTIDIEIVKIEEGTSKVEVFESEHQEHAVTMNQGVLSIYCNLEENWYNSIFMVNKSKVTVYLLDKEYQSLLINQTTGDIKINSGLNINNVRIETTTGDIQLYELESVDLSINLTTGNIYLKDFNSTGNITLNQTSGDAKLDNVACNNLTSVSTTGDINLKDVIVSENINIEKGTGDIEFYKIDASSLKLETTTGDIEGSLLSGKDFIVETTTGEKEYPRSSSGGKCEVKTTTGDIEITIAK